MQMTMTQKILAAHAGIESVHPGQLIEAKIDIAMGNDITMPIAISEFGKIGGDQVFDKEKVVVVLDHFTPNKDIKSAEQCKISRNFAEKMRIKHFYDVGETGIEHALLPEKGIVTMGDVVIGADSHTCTYGAIGSFSTGVGSTDLAVAMTTGKVWFKVPQAIKVVLTGKPQGCVSGKDIILHLIGLIGVKGALYKSLEFYGDGLKYLSMDDRFTICNMVVEAGAKNGIFPADEKALEYCLSHGAKRHRMYEADPNAEYENEIEIDLSLLRPTVAFPHLPSNTRTIDEAVLANIKIDQVVIGSCTNGRISDMETADRIFKGRHVVKGLRVIIIPATQNIYLECIRRGYVEDFIRAGAVFSVPTCGPCLGGYMGILASEERCVSTTNRNFTGRMGAKDSEVYLASPAVAAASAIKGYITDPGAILNV